MITSESVQKLIKNSVQVEPEFVITNREALNDIMDDLVWLAVFGNDTEKNEARYVIWNSAQLTNNVPSSIHDFYVAKATGEVPLDITTPAINLRGMAYDMAQVIFKVAKRNNIGAFVFELARSEMGYTDQSPAEYSAVLLAAAIKSNWDRPLFIQGDHFQTKVAEPGVPKDGEVETIKNLILEAMNYGFYNIDIDTSTLVDLDKPTEKEQQEPNVKYSLEFAKFVRDNEPDGITISLGGEIGHIGGKNSTVEDFYAYIEGFNNGLRDSDVGMSKISIQTGTSHGGVVLPDGTLADISVDFQVLLDISRECRKMGMGGAVQHGASTLPDEYFNQFTKSEAVEVHLATGFQNIIMDHPKFPKDLLEKMYKWADENKSDERKEGQTDEQFHYKTRKKAWGLLKKGSWSIDKSDKEEIMKALEDRFEFLFGELNVADTYDLVDKLVKPVKIYKELSDFSTETVTKGKVKGLAD